MPCPFFASGSIGAFKRVGVLRSKEKQVDHEQLGSTFVCCSLFVGDVFVIVVLALLPTEPVA
jgi:hypothetical protein